MTSHAMTARHRAPTSPQTPSPTSRHPLLALLAGGLLGVAVAACGGAATSTASPTAAASSTTPIASPSASASGSASASTSPAPSQDASPEPATGAGTAHGDVPDNAVYLPYTDPTLGFSIQYVEGWQVRKAADGVVIADKDSSETVRIVSGVSDAAAYVSGTDLPALKAMSGFKLSKQDSVKVGSVSLVHLAYHIPSPPDPVTGKQVPSTVDRYYVPGPSGLAVVTLSTPDGVDNVDAFRQMIESFRWK